MGWQDGDVPGQQPQPTVTQGFGQESIQVPQDNYLLGTKGTGQDMTSALGSQAAFAAQNPDTWYLDPQARASPEGQSAFKTAFDKGPADPKSWFDWAQHLEKFYGIGSVAKLSGEGWFDRFNMSPEEKDQMGRWVAQRQDKGDDPLFGNTGLTIPNAIMMLGGAAVGGAGGWAGGGVAEGAVGGDVAFSGGEGTVAGSGGGVSTIPTDYSTMGAMQPVGPASTVDLATGATGTTAGTSAAYQGLTGVPSSFASPIDASGFGGDFDIASFAANPSEIGMEGFNRLGVNSSGFGSSFDSPGMPMDAASGGFDDWWKKFKGLPWRPAGAALNLGSGIYGLHQAGQMRKLATQAQDPHTGQYRDQLAALMADPSSVKNIPGYQFGMDEGRRAIERRGAASGSGGNEAIALARYTPEYAGKFYDMEARRLANLSQGNPSAMIQGNAAASQLSSQALASLGYGAFMMGSSKFPW